MDKSTRETIGYCDANAAETADAEFGEFRRRVRAAPAERRTYPRPRLRVGPRPSARPRIVARDTPVGCRGPSRAKGGRPPALSGSRHIVKRENRPKRP